MTDTFKEQLRAAILEAIEEVGLDNWKKGSSWFMSNRSKINSTGGTLPQDED